MADMFGVPVVKITEDECAALGAALQAAWCLGRRENTRASIADYVRHVVTLDEQTRCAPAKRP